MPCDPELQSGALKGHIWSILGWIWPVVVWERQKVACGRGDEIKDAGSGEGPLLALLCSVSAGDRASTWCW